MLLQPLGDSVVDTLNRFVSSEGRLSRKGYIQAFLAPLAALTGWPSA